MDMVWWITNLSDIGLSPVERGLGQGLALSPRGGVRVGYVRGEISTSLLFPSDQRSLLTWGTLQPQGTGGWEMGGFNLPYLLQSFSELQQYLS